MAIIRMTVKYDADTYNCKYGRVMKYDIQTILKRYDSGESLEFQFFWGHHGKPDRVTKACLSQWFPASFEVDGDKYNLDGNPR